MTTLNALHAADKLAVASIPLRSASVRAAERADRVLDG